MIPPPSSTALAAAIAGCGDKKSLIAAFDAFVAEIGACYAVWYSFVGGVEAAAEQWTPVCSTFPNDIKRYYAETRCIEDDPFVRAALESALPVRFLDIKNSLNPSDRWVGLLDRYFAMGIVDGLFMQVCERPGRLAYVGLAFDRTLEHRPKYELRRLHAAIAMFAGHATALDEAAAPRALSPSERAVMVLLARGASNKEIARCLGLSPSTVNTLMNRCFEKLGASTRAQAAIAATRHGVTLVA